MAKKRERKHKRKNRRNDKTDIGAETKPGNPGKPVSLRWARAGCGAPMKVFPAWMYGDPAIAVERIESIELRAAERKQAREAARDGDRRQASYGLVSAATVTLIKRARIRELMRTILKTNKC